MNWLRRLFSSAPHAPVDLWTGRVVHASEFKVLLGAMEPGADITYAEVNAGALPEYYRWFRSKMFDLGVTKWDARLDCDDFTNLYVDLLQLKFYLGKWESSGRLPDAQALAAARVWYVPASGAGRYGHAVAALLTQEGVIYVEPQTGERLRLTAGELASRYRNIY